MSNCWITIPSELIGSLPRLPELIEAQRTHKDGELTTDQLNFLQEKDIQNVLFELERTGSIQLTDGELTKPSFLNYPIYRISQSDYSFDDEFLPSITCIDGRRHFLPKLTNPPFRYATYAVEYLKIAQKYTKHPLKQTVIAPSTLAFVYDEKILLNYSRKEFFNDLINESEKDIRQCLIAGADKVQLDLIDGKLFLSLNELIEINNQVLDRFTTNEKSKLGVHICSTNNYLNEIFKLHLNNFYIEFSREKEPERILSIIKANIHAEHRIFLGVIDVTSTSIETIEQIRDRIILAAKYIPIGQLGTTDDCGFAPFNDDDWISREKCYEKIRARIQGTKLAEEYLNQSL